jgi:hypothetical protein
MGTFTTKLKLGGPAFCVNGGLDPTIQRLTVGQIRVIETLPSARVYNGDVCYKEEYMCVETGVGSGTVWTYGTNIFASEDEAQQGVLAHRQAAHKQIAERDAYRAQEDARRKTRELAEFQRLKAQYEPS